MSATVGWPERGGRWSKRSGRAHRRGQKLWRTPRSPPRELAVDGLSGKSPARLQHRDTGTDPQRDNQEALGPDQLFSGILLLGATVGPRARASLGSTRLAL